METLRKKIKNKSANIVIIGLGYVGLPVACLLAKNNFSVVGLDKEIKKVNLINKGISPIQGEEPDLENLIKKVVKAKKFFATTNYSVCKSADVVLIAVETPVDPKTNIPKYKALKNALNSLGGNINPGSLVIIESTIAPGTMKNVVRPTLEKSSGLLEGKDFYLANCPERVTPGRLLHQLENWPRVVGGLNRKTAEVALELYKKFVKGNLSATTSISAEIVKTEENSFRDMQIATANSLALLCEYFGANVYEVIDLIKKDPARKNSYLLPGSGVGGHCLPKDGYLKISFAKKHKDNDLVKYSVQLVELSRKINEFMPRHVFDLLEDGFKEVNIEKRDVKIVVLGYAYMANSDDIRNSPTEVFLKFCKKEGLKTKVHDPFVKKYAGSLEEIIKGADALVFMTAHDEYKKLALGKIKSLMKGKVLIDGRNLFDKEKAWKNGLVYRGIGNV